MGAWRAVFGRRRRTVAIVAMCFGGVAIASACGTEQTGAMEDAEPIGGAGGDGGASGAATGGSAGTVNDAGSPVSPQWVTAGELRSCKLERVANVEELSPLFTWQGCGSGCERSEFATTPWFETALDDLRVRAGGSVTDANGTATIALQLIPGSGATGVSIATDEAGRVRTALRVRSTTSGKSCSLGFSSTWGARFAVEVIELDEESGVDTDVEYLAAFIDLSTPTNVVFRETGGFFSLGIVQDLFGGLGDSAWVGGLSGAHAIISIAETGTVTTLAPAAANIASRRWPSSAGSHFLFTEMRDDSSVAVRKVVRITDGSSAPVDWLAAGDASAGSARYANTHVGFLRAADADAVSDFLYNKVEVWSTAWSTDPSELSPVKLGDYPIARPHPVERTSSAAGGHGYYLLGGPLNQDSNVETYSVWNLETGASREFSPDGALDYYWALGVTRQYAYVSLHEPPANYGKTLERRALGF